MSDNRWFCENSVLINPKVVAPVVASRFSKPEKVICQLSTRPGDCEKNNGDTFGHVVNSIGKEISKATLANIAGLNRFCPKPP